MAKPLSSLHGWIALDKPLGLTSTQALGRARRLLGGTKVGHGGTLDPLASGLLPLAFGEATKLISYVMDHEKEYEFTVCWGESRTTDDAEGTALITSEVRPDVEAIQGALSAFTGTIQQTPPAFSAIKLDGARAYDLARAGEEVHLEPRAVRIDSFQWLASPDRDHASFRVACGKGTYIRSLARDLALALGTQGYVSRLRRTRVGPFSVEKAVSLDDLEKMGIEKAISKALLPLKASLGRLETLYLSQLEADELKMGRKVPLTAQKGAVEEGTVFFAEENSVPVALVVYEAGLLRSVRGFHFA